MKLTAHINALEDRPRSKCRLWELVVNLPKKDGKYPRRVRRFHGTYREAQHALAEFKAECERKSEPSRMTFAEYAHDWHNGRVESGALAENTISTESTRIKAACRHIGAIEMAKITPGDITDMYTALNWSPKSIEGMHKTLSTLFGDAMRANVIDSKPTTDAKRPTIPQAVRIVPSPESVDAMVASLDFTDAAQLAVALCACCGLRREEAVALEWSDFADGSVTVQRAANPDGTDKSTKSGKPRTVPVPDSLMERLPAASGRVAPMRPDSLTRWWTRHREQFGMDGVRLHDLRHAYLTRLAMAGVHPRVMMELAGHTSIDVCMSIYTHVDDSARRDAVTRAFGA